MRKIPRNPAILQKAGSNKSKPIIRNFSANTKVLKGDFHKEILKTAKDAKIARVVASKRQIFDYELIANGGLAPLEGFLTKEQYESVVHNFRLPDGKLFPIPVVFDINEKTKIDLENGDGILAIEDTEGVVRAHLHVQDIWKPNKADEAFHVYGGDKDHPEIINLYNNINEYYVGGKLEVFSLPTHDDYNEYRKTPVEVQKIFQEKGWEKVVAFQTRNPMHYAHIELTKRAMARHDCNLLLNPVVGPTKPGDIDYKTRMECYKEILPIYPKDKILFNILPLAMRMGGPREAMFHALIRKNHGCTHFIVGRDHAGPGSNSKGEDIYGPYEARDFVVEHQKEIGVVPVPFDQMVYVKEDSKYYAVSDVPEGKTKLNISGTEVRRRLKTGDEIPAWFSNPKVVDILRRSTLEKELLSISNSYENEHPVEIIRKCLEMYGKDAAISFSGAEDIILLEYAKQTGLPFRVFSLDTGRLHPQTYEFLEEVEKHYGVKIEYTFPESNEVKELIRTKGLFSFFKDGHKECCTVRKVNPLRKQLGELKAWITGVRKDQSQTRTNLSIAQIDPAFKGQEEGFLVKFNPLSNISSKKVWEDIRSFDVPYNKLHSEGFISIGCQPCTRQTNPGMHEREGRWWWEEADQKECGLHKADGKLVRSKN